MDVWFHAAQTRPVGLSWWAFAPESPPLAPDFVTDHLLGSRFNKPGHPNFNKQGFRDRDDFGSLPKDVAFRLLLLGDSFAYGAAAIYDDSNTGFADLLEARLRRAFRGGTVIWNTGIPGIGQREELLHLKRYFPVLAPHVVLLTFYPNDIDENVYPPGIYYVYTDGTWAHRYIAGGREPRMLTTGEAWRRARGFAFEAASPLLRLRTASLVYRLWGRFKTQPDTDNIDKMRITKTLLAEISAYVSQHGSKLLVMLIPPADSINHPAALPLHTSVVRALEDLSVPFLDMRPYLTLADYTARPDQHWTKDAHRKASEVLFKYISANYPPR